VEKFKRWDKNGDGLISKEEIGEHIGDLTDLLENKTQPDGARASSSSGSKQGGCCGLGGGGKQGKKTKNTKSSPSPAKLSKKEEMARTQSLAMSSKLLDDLDAIDVNGDGYLDIWELIAWTLGRRKVPVEMLLYDISKGASKYLAPVLFGSSDFEVFHSSLLVYGSEYWYGGKVFRSKPPCVDQFGPPLTVSKVLKLEPSEVRPDLMVVRLGYTFVTMEEFVSFVKDTIMPRYTGVHQYDLLTHSCNHFSDECLHFLIGRGVPDHVLKVQRMALTPKIKALRPFLNKYMGGFSEHDGGGDPLAEDSVAKASAKSIDANEVLGEGENILVDLPEADMDDGFTPAVIIKDRGENVDIKYFCGESHTVKKTTVPHTKIKRRVENFSGRQRT